MRQITKKELKKIIKEETQKVVDEAFGATPRPEPTSMSQRGQRRPGFSGIPSHEGEQTAGPGELSQSELESAQTLGAKFGIAADTILRTLDKVALTAERGAFGGKPPEAMEEGEEPEEEEEEELSPDEGGPSGTSAKKDKRSRKELTGDI